MRMCRMRAHAKLIHVGFANNDSTFILEELDYRRIVRADEVLQYIGGCCRLQAFCANVIFYCDWLVLDAARSRTRFGGIVARGKD